MFISEIISRFRNLDISVEVDPALLPSLDCADKTTIRRIVSINLYQLIYAIGTIQSRRWAPSNRQKFTDKSDLIEKLYSNISEFRVKINDIRTLGPEVLATISEDFGVGISVVVAQNLFNIKTSTIQRIYGHDKRPDWECQTIGNRILIIESKGSSNINTSNGQQANALLQKSKRNGDVKIASLTVLNENTISENRFLDPPIVPNNLDPEIQNYILRAGHYSSVFSFLGHSTLSRYFAQMRKRLENTITSAEQLRKDSTFRSLRDRYKHVAFDGKTFTGTFYEIDRDKYLFLGVDIRLISYHGFLEFVDYNGVDNVLEDNHFMLQSDGVLIIEIRNIDFFGSTINSHQIKNYQENITLSDVDSMNSVSFEKYISYELRKIGFEVILDDNYGDAGFDLIGFYKDRRYVFNLKLVKTKRISLSLIREFLRNTNERGKKILITNALPPVNLASLDANFTLVGRNELQNIFRSRGAFEEMLTRE